MRRENADRRSGAVYQPFAEQDVRDAGAAKRLFGRVVLVSDWQGAGIGAQQAKRQRIGNFDVELLDRSCPADGA
jgi:hypothetical protein